jgi:hypothetical protein
MLSSSKTGLGINAVTYLFSIASIEIESNLVGRTGDGEVQNIIIVRNEVHAKIWS